MNLRKLFVLIVVISMIGSGIALSQGPPEDVGPPGHAGASRGNVEADENGEIGPPGQADDRTSPPEHAKDKDRLGPPAHANVPDMVRNMIIARAKGLLDGFRGGLPVFTKVYEEVYSYSVDYDDTEVELKNIE